MKTDGSGIRTLIGMSGCPLSCKFCINKEGLSPESPVKTYTVHQLIEEIEIDSLYFSATDGGVTFGGGEPLLQADFIREFAEACPMDWKIALESSLNVPQEELRKVIGLIDHYFVDIKTLNPAVYRRYTGGDFQQAFSNLLYLKEQVDPDQITVRIPTIPGYTVAEDRHTDRFKLMDMGFRDVDWFQYQVSNRLKEKR